MEQTPTFCAVTGKVLTFSAKRITFMGVDYSPVSDQDKVIETLREIAKRRAERTKGTITCYFDDRGNITRVDSNHVM